MARWTASAKWAAGPALDGQRDMPLALRLSEGLGHKLVVLAIRADPKPMHSVSSWQPEGTVVQAHPCAVHLATAEELELQRRMRRISLQ